MPGLWVEIHQPQEYHFVPVENTFRAGRENTVVIGLRCGCFGPRGSFWCPGNHDTHLVVPQRDAGQEAARTLHARIGADSCAAGRTVGECEALDPGYVGLDGLRCHYQNHPSHPGEWAYSGNGFPHRA